jgi:aminoglycoside 3-N-acetyltransferase I
MRVERLTVGQLGKARALFALLSEVLGEKIDPISDVYIDRLLGQDSFWAFAALDNERIVAGLTGHVLMMTNAEGAELLIYDIAVDEGYQRQGVGRRLIESVRNEASAKGIRVVFVLADNSDVNAIDFYRKLGGADSAVTLFAWNQFKSDRVE